jgi:hypothetical protein
MMAPKCVMPSSFPLFKPALTQRPEFSLIMQILNQQDPCRVWKRHHHSHVLMSANFAIVRIKTSASNGLAKCAS